MVTGGAQARFQVANNAVLAVEKEGVSASTGKCFHGEIHFEVEEEEVTDGLSNGMQSVYRHKAQSTFRQRAGFYRGGEWCCSRGAVGRPDR